MPNFNQVLVASGFDQTLDANDNIEALTPNVGNPQRFKGSRAGMVYFAVTNREFSEGEARFDLSKAEDFAGHRQVIYVQPACHPDSYAWLLANLRGQVTCQIVTDGTEYSTWNAFLSFKKSASTARIGWLEVHYVFTLLEEIA